MNILVTGANKGIGKEVVRQLSKNNNNLIATGRDLHKITAAADELKLASGHQSIFPVQLDVTNTTQIQAAVDFAKKRFGHLDILINNAGIFNDQLNTCEVSISAVEMAMNTNFYGPLRMSQAFLPLLKLSKAGRIINVSSKMGALTGMEPGYAAYRISKTALNGLTANMAADLVKDNIKVFAVTPGWVKTDMGGPNAARTLLEGGQSVTWLVDAADAVSGRFYDTGQLLDW